MVGLERKGILFVGGNDRSRDILQHQWLLDVGASSVAPEDPQEFDQDLERVILEEMLEEDKLDLPQVEVPLAADCAGHGPRIMGLTVRPCNDSRKKWQFNKIVLRTFPDHLENDS